MTEKKPVLVQVQAEQVCVLQLGPKNEQGAHSVPFEPFKRVGAVTVMRAPEKDRRGRDRIVSKWYAHTLADQRLGPFPSTTKAIAALLDQLGLVQVKATATMEPLF